MGARVRWSRHAKSEVVEIRDYVERDSKANAVQIVGEFMDLIVGSYRLMYRVSSGEITVFSIRHTRRRVPKRFRSEWLR